MYICICILFCGFCPAGSNSLGRRPFKFCRQQPAETSIDNHCRSRIPTWVYLSICLDLVLTIPRNKGTRAGDPPGMPDSVDRMLYQTIVQSKQHELVFVVGLQILVGQQLEDSRASLSQRLWLQHLFIGCRGIPIWALRSVFFILLCKVPNTKKANAPARNVSIVDRMWYKTIIQSKQQKQFFFVAGLQIPVGKHCLVCFQSEMA